MANQGVNITVNSADLVQQFHNLDRNIKKVVEEFIKTEALNFQKDVRKQLTENKSVITGRLRRSITVEKYYRYEYHVGTNVHYAPYVEFGTRRTGGKGKPYFQPVIDRRSEKFKEELAKLIRGAIA